MRVTLINKTSIEPLLQECAKIWNIYTEDRWECIPPKEIFFPQLESLFEIKDEVIKETVECSKKLLFGIRPCDYKGIEFLDEFFKRNFDDKYYLSRAKDRLVIVKGCITPPWPDSCFCTSTQTGPFLDKGFDIQLIDIGRAYLVEVGSKEGEEFVLTHKRFFKECSESDKDEASRVKRKAKDSIKLKVDFSRALGLMKDGEKVPEELYEKIAQRCIHCGGCIYVCPTCTCFNVFDDTENSVTRRYRNWDACVFEGFTRETSGFNPRPTKWLRASRRYEHKLRHDYEVTGKSGCVGCGRCLATCPVGLGMSKFIEELTA